MDRPSRTLRAGRAAVGDVNREPMPLSLAVAVRTAALKHARACGGTFTALLEELFSADLGAGGELVIRVRR